MVDDPAQTAAAEHDLATDSGWIAHVVLAETVWVLKSFYERSREEIVAAIRVLLDHDRIAFEDPEVVGVAVDLFGRRRGVEFSDCLVLAIAGKAGRLPLATFDKDLFKLPGTRRLRG